MKTNTFPLLIVFLMIFAVSASAGSLESRLQAHEEVSDDTILAPLMMSGAGLNSPALRGGFSLFNVTENVGFSGDLRYQIVDPEGIRIQYANLSDDAAFFWLFDKPVNISDQWVRIRYSGSLVPSVVGLVFDEYEARKDSGYGIYLDPSAEETSVFFKMPRKETFETVETMRLEIAPDMLESPFADFMIHGVDIMPAGFDPSTGYQESLADGQWQQDSFEAQNQVSLRQTANA